jgi:hypothetical protein
MYAKRYNSNIHSRNIFPREGVCCVTDKKTSLSKNQTSVSCLELYMK